MNNTCVVFDLDDTLFKERDFLISAYRYIADKLVCSDADREEIFQFMYDAYGQGKDVFSEVIKHYSFSVNKEDLLSYYRYHFPNISLDRDARLLLDFLKMRNFEIGLLTDGRTVTQRNKIKALALNEYISEKGIIISEEFGSSKPAVANYQYFESKYPLSKKFIYVADNPTKDFVTPNRLGWLTIGLINDGRNIHEQVNVERPFQPKLWVNKLAEVVTYINKVFKTK